MAKWYREKETFRHILWLTIIYGAAHWFLLVMTGKWWDDWVYANHNVEYLIEVCMQSSLPLEAFVKMSVWNLPYKWLVFLYFYLDGVLVYSILKKTDLFCAEASFWIAALFMTIPVNDARVTWICYGYSFYFLLFWISFYLVTCLGKLKGGKKSGLRIVSLLILLVAFHLESTMLMTLLILFYLYYEELKDDWRWSETRNNVKKLFMAVIHNIDFLIAPIAWYVLNKVLFPGYGIYGGHSYIPWNRLVGIVMHSPVYALNTLKSIIVNYSNVAEDVIARIFILVILAIYIIVSALFLNKKSSEKKHLEDICCRDIIMILLGALSFYICFFPYGVKRGQELDAFLINSRDTMLLGIGMAILIYFCARVFFREKVFKVILVFTILLGVMHFNYTYLIWQESYYQQLQLQDEIRENSEIQNNNTFLVLCKNTTITPCFYQNNGNSWAVTGEETRMFMSSVGQLDLIRELDEGSWWLNAYGMKDYDYTDKKLDGIIFIDYAEIGKRVMLRQKWNELFDEKAFYEWINSVKNVQYVALTSEESDKIWKEYENGALTNGIIYEWYYEKHGK